MPPRQRDAGYRRRAEQSERVRRHLPTPAKIDRVPRIEAYDRNKRNSVKVEVRRSWVDW